MRKIFSYLTICSLVVSTAGAQTISGKLADSLSHDVNVNGIANPGDSVRYKATIKNTGGSSATGANYNNPTPANTTLGTGTVKTSALARNDAYSTAFNTAANGNNVLSNDYGVPSPSVLSYGTTASPSAHLAATSATSNGGGTFSISSSGVLNYSPASGFTGFDQLGYIAGTGTTPNNDATVTVTVGTPPSAVADAYNVIGNVNISDNVKTNDGGDATVVSAVNGSAGLVGVATTTTQGGNVTVNANGSFTYNPAPGFEGSDNFSYAINNGFNAPSTATVSLTVAGMIWFVNNSGANGDGRLSSPFNSLASLSNGAGGSAANDNIFIYTGSGSYTSGVTLLAGQKLVGQGATASLASILSYTVPSYSASLPSTSGTAPTIAASAGNDVTLGNTNSLRGITLGTATGNALSGTSFGTVTVSEVSINTTGQAISLTTGTLSGTLTSVTSSGGTNNVAFTGCAGSLTIAGGALAGTSSGAAFMVSGGTASITTSQVMNQSNNAALVSISGGHNTGTLTFQTGALGATNGTGLQFDNADGIYNFSGTATLNGGDAGVDITNGSSGNFSFTNTIITNPSGAAFLVSGGSGSIGHGGTISKTSSGKLIDIQSRTGGSVSFAGNLSSTSSSTGINVSSCSGGTVTFDGATKTINTGANTAITLSSNSGATINFSSGGLAITTTSGTGLNATGGGTITISGSNNTVSSGSGTAVNIQNTTIGAGNIVFTSVATSGGTNGLVLNSTGAGTFTVTGIGSTAGSGGIIQNTSGSGILLTSAQSVNLSLMMVKAAGFHGVNLTGTTSLSLTKCRLETNGNGDDENSLYILNTSGTVLIDNCIFFGAAENLIRVDNNNANLNFTVQNNTQFEFPNPKNSAFANSAILLTYQGSSIITASVQGNSFKNIPVCSFQMAPGLSASATSSAIFSNNTISVDVGLNVTCASNGECRTGFVSAGGTGGTTNFTALSNTFTRVNGDGVFILGANQSSTLKAKINSNSISNAIDDAFVIGVGQNGHAILEFDGNNVNTIGGDGFEVASGETNAAFSGDLDLSLTNNTIANHSQNSSLAFVGAFGIFRFGDADQQVCLKMTGNVVTGTPNGFFDIYLDGNFGGLGGNITYQTAGTGTLTEAQLQAANPGTNVNNIVSSGVVKSNGVSCQTSGL
jgi:hypothetical protein